MLHKNVVVYYSTQAKDRLLFYLLQSLLMRLVLDGILECTLFNRDYYIFLNRAFHLFWIRNLLIQTSILVRSATYAIYSYV